MSPGREPATIGDLQVSVHDGVATISFAHPRGNSLPSVLLRRLADGLLTVSRTADARVILLRSGGDGAFCAGIRDRRAGKEFFLGFARVILAMIRAPQPIVTRVHGRAVGGGLGLIAASDYVMATADAAVRLSELSLGLGPFVVGPALERKVGAASFAAMALDTDWRSGAWAERAGLYSRVFDDAAALDTGVDTLVRQLAAANPAATARLKAALWEGTEHWDRLLEERAEASGDLLASEYGQAALASLARP